VNTGAHHNLCSRRQRNKPTTIANVPNNANINGAGRWYILSGASGQKGSTNPLPMVVTVTVAVIGNVPFISRRN
jgi:hypothetical protein